jgi:hypothetical protein
MVVCLWACSNYKSTNLWITKQTPYHYVKHDDNNLLDKLVSTLSSYEITVGSCKQCKCYICVQIRFENKITLYKY